MQIHLPHNLEILRDFHNKTQAETASSLGLKRSTYVNYEKGGNEPSLDVLLKIANLYGLNIEQLLTEKLEKGNLNEKTKNKFSDTKGNLKGNPMGNPLPEKSLVSGKTERIKELQKLADEVKETFGKTGAYNVHDFDGHAAAGQAIALLEEDKKRREPNMYLPGLGPGLHVRVTAIGESMFPSIKPGDKAVSTWVPDLKEVRSGEVYLVIDANDGAVYKRLYKEGKTHLRLESDNEMFRPYTRHLEDILALFRVREVHTTDLRPFWADIRRDVANLKAEMEDIRCLLQQK